MGTKRFITTLLLGFLLGSSFAHAANKVARVILLKERGKEKVKMTSPDGKVSSIKKGQWIIEGSALQTPAKSFVKLLFIDKSQMSLGPKSKMVVNKFPKKKAGVITLLKGQIRSKVTKNYLEMKKGQKSKLFIRTKTAAMGVRGTDFQVNYNPINQNTSLVTFSGAVAMAQVQGALKDFNNQAKLERIVSSDKAVIVKKGQFSGVMPGKTSRATMPVKISPAQLNSMKKNDGQKSVESTVQVRSVKAKRKFRSPIPPGVNSKAFANTAQVDKQMVDTLGSSMTQKLNQDIQLSESSGYSNEENSNTPPPEGMVNKVTGQIAPPAGGYIDQDTAQYIPPPQGSVYDAQAQVYIPPATMGSFDPEMGGYIPPPNMELQANGNFTHKASGHTQANQAAQSPSRGLASIGPGPTGEQLSPAQPVMSIQLDQPMVSGDNFQAPTDDYQSGDYAHKPNSPAGHFNPEEVSQLIENTQESAQNQIDDFQDDIQSDGVARLRLNLTSN